MGIEDSSKHFGSDVIACIQDLVTAYNVKATFSFNKATQNCYLVNYQTPLPCHMYPDVLLDKILRETMDEMREDFLQDNPDYFLRMTYLK